MAQLKKSCAAVLGGRGLIIIIIIIISWAEQTASDM